MKSVVISHSDLGGGAAIAAYRIHRSVLANGVESAMWVDSRISDDWTVSTHKKKSLARKTSRLRASLNKFPAQLMRSPINDVASFNWLPSSWPSRVNQSDCDVVNLVWFNKETLSIADVAKIRKPLVHTLQDMWAFCGHEHYTEETRWKDGYSKASRSSDERGIDLKRWTYQRKKKHWKEPHQLVATTHWMADLVRDSALFKGWPVTVIGNPLDTQTWTPVDRTLARDLFGLPHDKKIMLFGAVNGTRNKRKGFDLLQSALELLHGEIHDAHIVVFGQSEPQEKDKPLFPTTYVGQLKDQVALKALYSAADVYVNPARQEAFGQTGSEAQACGLPVVVFEQTGLAEVVQHKKTGYLARYLDTDDLASGIQWILNQDDEHKHALGTQARQWVSDTFSYDILGRRYKALYEKVSRQEFESTS